MDDIFEQNRDRLMAIAYRMLGSVAEAEDAVQETYLRWHGQNQAAVDNPAGWLTTVITRLSIDRLRVLQREREQYPGPWLPVPVASTGSEAAAIKADSVSYALLVLLEKLSPVERAVFLLREIFEFDYESIAQTVEKRPNACRQIFSRAKKRLGDEPDRFSSTSAAHETLFQQFVVACQTGDFDGLLSILTDDVVVYSDGGGRVPAARQPIFGADKAARFILGLMRLAPADAVVSIKPINRQMALTAEQNGVPILALLLDTTDSTIRNIYFMRNPDKLGWV